MLNIALSTILITFLLLPGIIWSLIWMKYSKTKPQTDKFYFLIYSLVASVFCYFAAYLLSKTCLFFSFTEQELIEIFSENLTISKLKIISHTCLLAFIIAIISIIGSHKKLIIKVLNSCNITNKNGDEDLWEQSLHNYMIRSKDFAFIRIHDFNRNLMYHGHILNASEDKKEREILLDKVEIFNESTAIKICEMKEIYLTFDHKNFIIEFLN